MKGKERGTGEAVLVLPPQLFREHPQLQKDRPVFLAEAGRYFSAFRFHRQKLILHRATMQAYRERLEREGYHVTYLDHALAGRVPDLLDTLKEKGIARILLTDPCDQPLEQELLKEAAARGMELVMDETPLFLLDRKTVLAHFSGLTHYSLTQFYVSRRKATGILVDQGKPRGGRWTFDTSNREPLPRGLSPPPIPEIRESGYVRDARSYVKEHFPLAPGEDTPFPWPVTHGDADTWLQDFLEKRLAFFGTYEDAIHRDEPFLFHSLLSPLLNIGLLTPKQVVDAALGHAEQHEVPLNSLEGFIRQMIGWREFIRAIYVVAGERQRKSNFWGHMKGLPPSLYTASTGILPVDDVIRRVYRNGFAHHIERLMVLGNFMLLSGIHPDDVYRWFMELFIDSYDWVMVPNVYGMSQYADGGLMNTKPYISGSNYLRRMSNYSEGDWYPVWDGLFWRFVDMHRQVLAKNPRTVMMVKTWEHLKPEVRKGHREVAEEFLQRFHGGKG
ncbi:MAG: cryptochrome/photolyase family protein [Methanomicrobiales archaeon]|nr:cryptochrome/photolyase family protein [Methanomicrobiales archaeon]